MIEQIDEPVDLLAFFSQKGKMIPRKFWRQGRVYDITKINQVHQSREGEAVLHFFHCSDLFSSYRKLSFNNITKIWTLEEVEVNP
jgi:hypothetical protein